jgi:hypothetical protein
MIHVSTWQVSDAIAILQFEEAYRAHGVIAPLAMIPRCRGIPRRSRIVSRMNFRLDQVPRYPPFRLSLQTCGIQIIIPNAIVRFDFRL